MDRPTTFHSLYKLLKTCLQKGTSKIKIKEKQRYPKENRHLNPIAFGAYKAFAVSAAKQMQMALLFAIILPIKLQKWSPKDSKISNILISSGSISSNFLIRCHSSTLENSFVRNNEIGSHSRCRNYQCLASVIHICFCPWYHSYTKKPVHNSWQQPHGDHQCWVR
eukprot:c15856_g1_i2 orf=62-556(+)